MERLECIVNGVRCKKGAIAVRSREVLDYR